MQAASPATTVRVFSNRTRLLSVPTIAEMPEGSALRRRAVVAGGCGTRCPRLPAHVAGSTGTRSTCRVTACLCDPAGRARQAVERLVSLGGGAVPKTLRDPVTSCRVVGVHRLSQVPHLPHQVADRRRPGTTACRSDHAGGRAAGSRTPRPGDSWCSRSPRPHPPGSRSWDRDAHSLGEQCAVSARQRIQRCPGVQLDLVEEPAYRRTKKSLVRALKCTYSSIGPKSEPGAEPAPIRHQVFEQERVPLGDAVVAEQPVLGRRFARGVGENPCARPRGTAPGSPRGRITSITRSGTRTRGAERCGTLLGRSAMSSSTLDWESRSTQFRQRRSAGSARWGGKPRSNSGARHSRARSPVRRRPGPGS